MTKYFENVKKNFGFGCMRFPMKGGEVNTAECRRMAWMICKHENLVPIPGTRKLERLKENGLAGDIVLSGAEVSAIDERLDTIRMSAVFGSSSAAKR